MTYIVAPNGIYSHRAATGNVVWDDTHTCWVLADNSTVQATAAELAEALALAGAAQAALWVAP